MKIDVVKVRRLDLYVSICCSRLMTHACGYVDSRSTLLSSLFYVTPLSSLPWMLAPRTHGCVQL